MTGPMISVVLPCRNEGKSLLSSINVIKKVFLDLQIEGEIIVSDSSSDDSPEIARKAGVVLIKHDLDGYGNACLEGLNAARGKYLFLADPDGTYDFSEIPKFISELNNGNDFVIGNRFAGKIEIGAMPWSHRYFGRYIFKILVRIFFKSKIEDIHCGMRALSRDAFERLRLRTTGMEFASEMIIKALKQDFKIKELPINYYPRQGVSKLKTMTDGWRHLRFFLLYSPMALFFWPGLIMFLFGLAIFTLSAFDSLILLNIRFQYHPVFIASLLVILGYQLIFFALFAKTYAYTHLGEKGGFLSLIHKRITIEKAGIFGVLLLVIGGIIYITIFCKWIGSGYGEMQEVKRSMAALTFVVVGFQTIVSAFMLSILGIKEK